MINEEEVFKVGYLSKPHGLGGEISFHFDYEVLDSNDCPYLVLSIDGILVPFFIEEYRFKSQHVALVKFEGISNAEKALRYQGTEVFFPIEYQEYLLPQKQSQDSFWHTFLTYTVFDENKTLLGSLSDVDTQTINILLKVVDSNNNELILPGVKDWLIDVNDKRKELIISLPEGLRDNE